jgi:hypothetical protein
METERMPPLALAVLQVMRMAKTYKAVLSFESINLFLS